MTDGPVGIIDNDDPARQPLLAAVAASSLPLRVAAPAQRSVL